jgi:hypothetical protein
MLEQGVDPELAADARDIATALPHAYARIGLPWLLSKFDVADVEAEHSYVLKKKIVGPPDGKGRTQPRHEVQFNSRPDFTAVDKDTNRVTVHDFKTASSFQQKRELLTWADNVQMMINSMQAMHHLDLEYYPAYYVHILLKGNEYAPSPLIHAYWQPEVPAMHPERWEPKYWLPPLEEGGKKRSIGRSFTKVRVSDKRDVGEWVWEMPSHVVADQIIILGPFTVSPLKVHQFVRGLRDVEQSWHARTEDLDWTRWGDAQFHLELDERFPRTFNCYNYGARCQFYNLCFRNPGWEMPTKHGFKPRVPHHTTEPLKEFIR